MALYKRKESPYWWIKLCHKGETIQRSTGTTNYEKAKQVHNKLEAEQWEQSKLGAKPVRSWQEAVLRFISETNDKKSHKQDLLMLRWLDAYLGQLFLNEINADVISDVRKACLQGRAKGTVNRYLSVMRAVLIKARDEWQWLDNVPKVRLFPEPKGRVRFLTPAQVQLLLKELPQYLREMVVFTLCTGLRHSNVIKLEWAHVNLEQAHMWVDSMDSKNGKALAIPLNAQALAVLRRQVDKHAVRVFTTARGAPATSANQEVWRGALKRAGIENFRFHDLRHTWASLHVMNGTPTNELQYLGGWSSGRMVERYAHLSSSHLAKAAARLDAVEISYNPATICAQGNSPAAL